MKDLHLLQRHRILLRLKVMWSGQGRHRFKIILRFDKGKMVFLPLSVKIRSRYWSHQILGASEVRFSAISAVCSIAGVVIQRLINFRLPAPFLLRCKPQVGFFCCLSRRHVKVLGNDLLRQHFGTAASLFSAPLLRLFLHFLVFFLSAYVFSFKCKLIQAFHCTLYCFFVLIKDEFVSQIGRAHV